MCSGRGRGAVFYSNSSVCDKAQHYVGPSQRSEDELQASGRLLLRSQLQIKCKNSEILLLCVLLVLWHWAGHRAAVI